MECAQVNVLVLFLTFARVFDRLLLSMRSLAGPTGADISLTHNPSVVAPPKWAGATSCLDGERVCRGVRSIRQNWMVKRCGVGISDLQTKLNRSGELPRTRCTRPSLAASAPRPHHSNSTWLTSYPYTPKARMKMASASQEAGAATKASPVLMLGDRMRVRTGREEFGQRHCPPPGSGRRADGSTRFRCLHHVSPRTGSAPFRSCEPIKTDFLPPPPTVQRPLIRRSPCLTHQASQPLRRTVASSHRGLRHNDTQLGSMAVSLVR